MRFKFISGHNRHKWTAVLLLIAVLGLVWCTARDLQPLPDTFSLISEAVNKTEILDRNGVPLSVTYQNDWNLNALVAFHDVPKRLIDAFIFSEDKRFYRHGGVDWYARANALYQNVKALRVVRGASTLTEQAVRMLHPRPRKIWSRWLEGFEAARLEELQSKVSIFEFYLNQVPYVGGRRGVLQAARHYFARDLDTLSGKEMLALAVLVRAPSSLDLSKGVERVETKVNELASRMHAAGALSAGELKIINQTELKVQQQPFPENAAHFVRQVSSKLKQHRGGASRLPQVHASIDAALQQRVRILLENRIREISSRQVSDGAVLVIDHKTNQVLAWVNAGSFFAKQPGSQIDAVLALRQPGSTLKPFLYALALERGWTAATLINDNPLKQSVGGGVHEFNNYSRRFYGPIRLRLALGNSLNIPAVRTVQFVGRAAFLAQLRLLGFSQLEQHPDYYGDGLALGNAEVSLFELVRAFGVLARGGIYRDISLLRDVNLGAVPARRVFSSEVVALMGNMLSDPQARRLEFGQAGLLRFPVQTAVKTGTSNDFRDAWALGYSHRYVVGVWMGNLDQRPMQEVSGAVGPALILRAIFAELERRTESQPLYLHPELGQVAVCALTGKRAREACPQVGEWFRAEKSPEEVCSEPHIEALEVSDESSREGPRIKFPTPGLNVARDPRIPDRFERFPFELVSSKPVVATEWIVDGKVAGSTGVGQHKYLWPLEAGKHRVHARLSLASGEKYETGAVGFVVK
ncbi:transglycosylase domain-containing protein [Oligoflexia bacterium]|nr:transglycosylase domain-containing protein [Oligoflexia bacterium]